MPIVDILTNTPVSAIILVVTIAISYYALEKNQSLYFEWMLHPFTTFREQKYQQLVTHGFIHGSWMHLFINMYVFYNFAFPLEQRILGSVNFAIVYFGSLIISGIISVFRRQYNSEYRSLGASGAISGLLFSFILFYPNAQLLLFFVIPMPAWLAAIVFLGGSYYLAVNKMMPGIDHEAHMWGALSGLALTILLVPESIQIFIRSMFG